MSLVLQPQNAFTVVRQISNHLDTDVNYVQAVIRNAYTDAIIETIQLDDKGGQRFTKNWQVPADTLGQGFYISIVTSVYTDSGYTTKNANYGDEESTYLVQERVMRLGGGGGGVDAYTVRQIIKEELAKIPTPEPVDLPEQVPVRFDEVLAAIARVGEKITQPKDAPSLSPVLAGLSAVQKAIDAKEVTPATDLAPVIQQVAQAADASDLERQVIKGFLQELADNVINLIKSTIRKEFEAVQWTSKFTTEAKKGETPAPQYQDKPAAPVPFDITKLAG